MKAMTDHIHAQGLRAGIYSSPGSQTCQRFEGSLSHEVQDAEQFASWGFDFLKYDWCTYGTVYRERMKATGDELLEKQRPFKQMGEILAGLDRDVVLNLCQYGMNDVWKWGEDGRRTLLADDRRSGPNAWRSAYRDSTRSGLPTCSIISTPDRVHGMIRTTF